jgi:hypothetical protein
MDTEMKFAEVSPATAFAKSVFPVPGGPCLGEPKQLPRISRKEIEGSMIMQAQNKADSHNQPKRWAYAHFTQKVRIEPRPNDRIVQLGLFRVARIQLTLIDIEASLSEQDYEQTGLP